MLEAGGDSRQVEDLMKDRRYLAAVLERRVPKSLSSSSTFEACTT